MKKIYLVIAFLQLSIGATAQCPTNLSFSTQAQIDNFPAQYPNCHSYTGYMGISGPDIVNLNGLSQFNHIDNLLITNVPALVSYSGLDNLTSVIRLTINGNVPIVSGFPNLTSAKSISIAGCPITSIQGFNALQTCNIIQVIYNNSLQSINGFGSLVSMGFEQEDGGGLDLGSNLVLSNITAFNQLESVYNFLITDDPLLPSLEFLSNLETVTGSIRISQSAFTDLSGLESLTTVGELNIYNNPTLSNIAAIQNLDFIGTDLLRITQCPLLSICNYANICDYLSAGRPSLIESNAPGCESDAAIIAQCNLADATFQNPVLNLYPNPVTNQLTLNSQNAVLVTICNAVGQTIASATLKGGFSETIDMARYSSGLYFVKAVSNGKIEIYKILKL